MLSKAFLIFVSLALLQLAWTSGRTDEGQFDMVLLKLMWPPSDCINVDQCHVPKSYNTFSIHVFAPAYANGTMLQGCSGPAFDLNQLHNVRPALDVLWPDFFNDGKPEGFWKTNWDEHGVCGASWSRMANEELYFTSAMALRSSIWLAKGLELTGIVPSTNVSYALADIDKSVAQLVGRKACPHCKPFKDNVYLHEISFCFDKDFSLLDCPEGLRQSEAERCGGFGASNVIYWPVEAPVPL